MIKVGFWSPKDTQTLEEFFLREDSAENCMDVAMLDGFLTAVLSGPNLIMPSEVLRWVWDKEHGQADAGFRNQQEGQKIIGLIMQQWNAIASVLQVAPDQYEPLIYERKQDDGSCTSIIDEWCMGYQKGIMLDVHAWQPLLASQSELLEPVLLYGGPEGWESLERLDLSLEEHEALAERLPDMVMKVHAHWQAQRQQQQASGQVPSPIFRREPMRREGYKVGRNDPCHCGSGRKYKHCHGAN
jgi:uncharacterized protein